MLEEPTFEGSAWTAGEIMQKFVRLLLFVFAIGGGLMGHVHAETIVGRAIVIDGDTIEIGSQRIRLWGIDAPEGRQTCKIGGKPYFCGDNSTVALRAIIGNKELRCERLDTDRYRRIVARCLINGQDIGALMVRQGHALAFRRYSLAYIRDEKIAHDARAGMWRGEFEAPWDWRRR